MPAYHTIRLTSCILGLSIGQVLRAQETAPPAIVTTHHRVVVAGKALEYTARAGWVPLRATDTGAVHANLFFVAYTLDRPHEAPTRPLTFLWNGGPGSNSGLVHLLGFGPKRVTLADGDMPLYSSAGTALVDNQETWLAHSDLVFVDPIGTGYSRPTKPEYSGEFYQGPGDAEAVATFIRAYRSRFASANAPLVLMGESYGVTRASLVAEALERRQVHVTGVILLSGGLPLPTNGSPAVRGALTLPVYTAAAHFNKRLAPDLQNLTIDNAIAASKSYAEGPYASALAHRATLTQAQRDSVVSQLVRFTGLKLSQIDRDTLRVSMELLSDSLLSDSQRVIGHYDSRHVGERDTAQVMYDPTTDPSLRDILDGASVVHYLRSELGIKSEMFYQGPFGGGYPAATTFRGDWMSVRWNHAATQAGAPAKSGLAAATTLNPKLRVFMGCGYFDLVGDCFAHVYAAQTAARDLAGRITARIYAGGHAAYTDDAVRKQLAVDVANFIQSATRQ